MSLPRQLVVATKNSHKTGEIRAILGDLFDSITDMTAHPDLPSPEETGVTFEENAEIKALAASEALGPNTLVLADDSGIEVDALELAPGVYSSRYAGEKATDADNREKMLACLAQARVRGKERSGRFRCVMILAQAGNVLGTFSGAVEGIIADKEQGASGFGYDPIFIPEGYCETFGQLPSETKNSLSHRARALEQVREALEENSRFQAPDSK